jgi:hypothetical protein
LSLLFAKLGLNNPAAMNYSGALLTITKKKGSISDQDNALLKKVLGILDMDEFEDLNGEPFNLTLETLPTDDTQYLIKLTAYHKPDESMLKAAKENDVPLAKEVKDILTSTLGDQFSFKVGFEEW